MTDVAAFKSDPQAAIFDAMDDAIAVMLGNPKQGRTFQPMSPKVDRAARVVRFFVASDSDLYEGLKGGEATADVVCNVVAPKFDLFASIEGELVDATRVDLVDKHFDKTTEAWFERGKDDPKLRLVELRPKQAEAWASSDDTECFSWEIEKAAGEETTPDVGARLTADFTAHKAA
ncbi:MAG: pyridoxamine 5'-phosphate oxidase family protein [Oceanicaulis sp.]